MTDASSIPVRVLRLPHGADLPFPRYGSADAAGCDLLAALPAGAPLSLAPGARALIPTGIALQLPAGFEAQVRPRSGLALTHGLGIPNAPGTIDADYRGEVGVILVNWGTETIEIARGMRIAQLVFAPVTRAVFAAASELATSARGAGGFGSTGTGPLPVQTEVET